MEGLCSGVCSTLTGLAIDIAYLYTYASKTQRATVSLRSPFGGHPEDPHNQQTSLGLDLVKLREQVIEYATAIVELRERSRWWRKAS